MIKQSIERLSWLCEKIPPLLNELSETELSSAPPPGHWSRKEIIGHLIDSATNNHHRFVRGQYEDVPSISYDPDAWNDCGHYRHIDSRQLISFWTAYNRQLLALIQLIPEEKLLRSVHTGSSGDHIIEFLIADYVTHMEHHLRQIVDY